MKLGTACILTNGKLDSPEAKTAHGLIRGTERFDIVGVVDERFAGGDAGQVLDGVPRGIPVYPSLAALTAETGQKPDYAVVGMAISGGRLDETWHGLLLDVLGFGVSIVNGLHMLLSDIPEFREAAQKAGVEILDIRRPKPFGELRAWTGEIYTVATPRLAVLGTDCALGKRTTARMVAESCGEAGIPTDMIYTGQTGWLQGYRYGFIFDATLNDFVSSELEAAILECHREAAPDLILVEGQSSLRNPLGPAGAEIIVSGNIKGVILQHVPFREMYDDLEYVGCLLPDVESEIKLMEMYGTRVIAVTLNGKGGTAEALSKYSQELEKRLGLPVVMPLEQGVARLVQVIQQFMQDHDDLPDVTPRKRQ